MNGRTALVTGASRGLGKAIATKLALSGASVTLLARNKDLLEQTKRELPTQHQQAHRMLPIDLQDHNQLPNVIPYLNDCSILINCAGITNHKLLPRMPEEEIVNTININLTVPILLSRLAIKPMLKVKHMTPSIINISSILSLMQYSTAGTSVYAALKAGLDGFTRSLSTELRGKIRVNSILPSLMETDMGEGAQLDVNPVAVETVVQEVLNTIRDETINGECIVVK